MYDTKLADCIRKFLADNPDNQFKSGDIARSLHLKKHKRRDLEDTLITMKRKRDISGRNKRYYISTSSPSEIFYGKFDARPLAQNKSYAFVLQEGRDIYISREDVMNAYHDDLVAVEIKYEGKNYLHGYITAIKERARSKVVGKIQKYRNKTYLIPDNSLLHTDFEIYDSAEAETGKKVVCEITNWGDAVKRILPGCKVTRILGDAGDPDVEILSVICAYDLPLEFPQEVIIEADMLDGEIRDEDINDRIDLRKYYTITIDPASAKDYDDAISLLKNDQGFMLYVHIADVAHYVKPHNEIFKEAVNRGNSYYFPRKVIPMLPEKLSNSICSLRPEEDKLALSVITQYNKAGEIIEQNVYESIIRSNDRLSYEEVDAWQEKNNPDLAEDTQNLLATMSELSAILQKKRIKRGYLSLDLPETEYIFDEEGHVINLVRTNETESHQMIENFMLSANEFIAEFLSESDTLYRVHEAPDPDSIEDLQRLAGVHNFIFDLSHTINSAFQIALDSLETKDRHRVFDRVILRHMTKARYDVVNRGHFGLALSNYTHFTSPIRRLCDLIIHHQVKAKLHHEISVQHNQIFSRSSLEKMAGIATERETLADNSEREVDLKNKILFMKKKVGEEFNGIAIAIKPSAIIIEIDEYPVTGIVPLSSLKDDYYEYHAFYDTLLGTRKAQAIRLADRFKVLLVRVDEDIVFQILDK